MEGMKLVKEQCGVIEAFLGEGIVLEVVALVKGFDVVIYCGLAVINIIIDVLSKLFYPGSSLHNFHSVSHISWLKDVNTSNRPLTVSNRDVFGDSAHLHSLHFGVCPCYHS